MTRNITLFQKNYDIDNKYVLHLYKQHNNIQISRKIKSKKKHGSL